MISNAILETSLVGLVGYVGGAYVGTIARGAPWMGATIGAVAAIAGKLLQPVTFAVARHFQLEDRQIHLIKACTTALVTAATVAAFVMTGIVGTTGGLFIGFVGLCFVADSLDKAYSMRNSNEKRIINSENWMLHRV